MAGRGSNELAVVADTGLLTVVAKLYGDDEEVDWVPSPRSKLWWVWSVSREDMVTLTSKASIQHHSQRFESRSLVAKQWS